MGKYSKKNDNVFSFFQISIEMIWLKKISREMCNSIHKQQKQQIVEEEKSCNIYNRRRVSHKSWNCSTIQRRRRRRAPHDPQQVHRYQPHVICLTVADFFFFFQKCKIKKKKKPKTEMWEAKARAIRSSFCPYNVAIFTQ